jgi:sigma-B regulation protein RsbU (phosphoserine phosphatase)
MRVSVEQHPVGKIANQPMQVLLVNSPQNFEAGVTEVIQAIGGAIQTTSSYQSAIQVARDGGIDALIIGQPAGLSLKEADLKDFESLIRVVEAERIAALLVGDGAPTVSPLSRSLMDHVGSDVSLGELKGRLATIQRYHALLKRMQHEIRNMERLGKRLNQHFYEVDQEMRLAARLQRDFLPNLAKPIANVRFAAVYRPASWVSGDIYDVFRIDENHLGFYVADAVGHGMAASLLTMFIKRAMVAKRIRSDEYEIRTPSEILAGLNDALAEQCLPNCQFVTAWYGMLNTETLTLEYARGGHPYPVLIDKNSRSTELRSPGGLLGLARGEEFPTRETRLNPGDKLLLFSDGVEMVFQADDRDALDTGAYRQAFEEAAHLPIREMLLRIESSLDGETGSITPRDDVTVVGLEVLEP